jgi:Zn-dependent protease with chaperone function
MRSLRAVVVGVLVSVVSRAFAQEDAAPTPPPPLEAPPSESAMQAQAARAKIVASVCKAPEVFAGPEFDVFQRMLRRVAPIISQGQGHRIHVALVKSGVINAWTMNLNISESLICFPTTMVRYLGSHEGEVGFIFSHEVGHALDDTCKTSAGRLAVADTTRGLGASVIRLLHGRQDRLLEQRGCEARADGIGFHIFTAAGYNPIDAAGAFGRLELLLSDEGTGWGARIKGLASDHPITPDRIKHIRALLIEAATQRAASGL